MTSAMGKCHVWFISVPDITAATTHQASAASLWKSEDTTKGARQQPLNIATAHSRPMIPPLLCIIVYSSCQQHGRSLLTFSWRGWVLPGFVSGPCALRGGGLRLQLQHGCRDETGQDILTIILKTMGRPIPSLFLSIPIIIGGIPFPAISHPPGFRH